ncbi:hypothetical protein Egran_04925 [Elaphomyces granulatus]|uniref:Uncharacterized protein n=1 Tax=Elaphomyces granulatus TaxID=519963 RepID=A0A232LT19_9EURO|nr:hypothetical protein Egran_04925 [Elaphomyces granulatus]
MALRAKMKNAPILVQRLQSGSSAPVLVPFRPEKILRQQTDNTLIASPIRELFTVTIDSQISGLRQESLRHTLTIFELFKICCVHRESGPPPDTPTQQLNRENLRTFICGVSLNNINTQLTNYMCTFGIAIAIKEADMEPGSHINTGHSQQLGYSLRGSGQAGWPREDVPAGIARSAQITYQHFPRPKTRRRG